jgi:ketosteroid isomerase-like protein
MSNVELARTLYHAFNHGDIQTVLAAMDPAVEWREAEGNPYSMDGAPWIGPQAILEQFFARLAGDWQGLRVDVEKLYDAGDHVFIIGRGRGTYKPTGKTMDGQACHMMRFANGKLVSFQQYCDTAHLQATMKA